MVLKAALIAALVKLLVETENPLLCAGIYAVGGFLLGLIFGSVFGVSIPALLLAAVLAFVLAYVYFWLLNRIETLSFPWWTVLAVGLLIGLV